MGTVLFAIFSAAASRPASAALSSALVAAAVFGVAIVLFDEVNIHEAKTHLSRLLARVATGEEVIISKAGRPIARLVPIRAKTGKRVPGQDAGDIWIAEDFDEPLPPNVQSSFE